MDLATRIRDGARRGGDDAKNRGHFQTKGLAWREFRPGCSAGSVRSLRSVQAVASPAGSDCLLRPRGRERFVLAIPLANESLQFSLGSVPLRDTVIVLDVVRRGRPRAGELAEFRVDFQTMSLRLRKLFQDGAADVEVRAAMFGVQFKPVLSET